MPQDWQPASADIAYAMREHQFTHGEITKLGAAFRDHWHAATGQKATKLDWSAAWRTWCRNERSFHPRKAAAGGKPSVW